MAFINAAFTKRGGVVTLWVDAEEYHEQLSNNGEEVYTSLKRIDGMILAIEITDNLVYTQFKTKREELIEQINGLVSRVGERSGGKINLSI